MSRKSTLKTTGVIGIIGGILLMGLSLYLYNKGVTGFLAEVHSEIFGVGAGFFVAGGLAWIYGVDNFF